MTRLREKGGPADALSKAASEGNIESAKALLDTLDKRSQNQSAIPQIKRIQVSHLHRPPSTILTSQNGDTAYRHMIEISLLTEILSVNKSDSKVQNAVRSTLELCSQMSQEPISLLWPLLTAGAACIGDENRGWVRQLLDVFRPFYCQDLEVAVRSVSIQPSICANANSVGATPYGTVDSNGLWRWIHSLVGAHAEYG